MNNNRPQLHVRERESFFFGEGGGKVTFFIDIIKVNVTVLKTIYYNEAILPKKWTIDKVTPAPYIGQLLSSISNIIYFFNLNLLLRAPYSWFRIPATSRWMEQGENVLLLN